MPQVVPSLKPIAFEYSAFDNNSSLPVALKIFDLSGASPVLVTTLTMTNVFGGTYYASYTFPNAPLGKNYLIFKGVFLDNTFSSLSTAYSPGSEMVEVDGYEFKRSVSF